LWAPSYVGSPAPPQHVGCSTYRARVQQQPDSPLPNPVANRAGVLQGASHLLKGLPMLHYAVVFFVVALIAALFGFGGIAASAVGIAKILFVVFAVLTVASLLFGLVRSS